MSNPQNITEDKIAAASKNAQRLREALQQLLLPGPARVALAEAAASGGDIPACLDDAVMNALSRRGFTHLRGPVQQQDVPLGAQVSTCGDGLVYLVEVTAKGRFFLNTN